MDESRDVYHFGECKICKNITALKNGYCAGCNKINTAEYPDFLKDVFNGFSNSEKK